MSAKEEAYLLKLIEKLDNGTISNKEIAELSNFFTSHQDLKTWPLNDTLKNKIKDEVYQKIELEIAKRSHKAVVPLYRRPFFKYAVAAAIAILISLPFIVNKENPAKPTPIIVDSTIEVGTDKAILTLEDDTDIILENGQNYNSPNLSSNGKELIYTSTGSKREVAFNYLTIPRGGQYVVQLTDDTKIWLNSESKLKYPINFSPGEARLVELVYGEAYFEVSPSTAHEGSVFKVLTRTQEIEVLGTKFNVSAYQDEDVIYTTLAEGKVAVTNGTENVYLTPGQQSIIRDNDQNIEVVRADVYNATSWKEGVFSFDKMPLEKIMKVLARWYDMDVVFVNPGIRQDNFTGVLRKQQTIEEILESIGNANNVAYEINNNTVILR